MNVRRYSASDLPDIRDPWQSLQQRTGRPNLFSSWHWVNAWYHALPSEHREAIDLNLVCVLDADGRWLGLLPLVRTTINRRGLRYRALQFAGGSTGLRSIFRSEFLDCMIDPAVDSNVFETLMDALLADQHWDSLVLTDCDTPRIPTALHQRARITERDLGGDVGYRAELGHGFEHYLSGISASGRRGLFNKRRRLEQLGAVEHKLVTPENWEAFVTVINRFHEARWGGATISDRRSRFVRSLTQDAADADTPSQASSILYLDGKPISALLDIDFQGRRYSLQAGFDSGLPKAISPGLLHFGYSIEQAAASGLKSYEFLLGRGKHDDYKKSIATRKLQAQSRELVRTSWLRLVYRVYDALIRS